MQQCNLNKYRLLYDIEQPSLDFCWLKSFDSTVTVNDSIQRKPLFLVVVQDQLMRHRCKSSCRCNISWLDSAT